MSLSLENKKKYILNMKYKIDNCLSILIINFKKLKSNDLIFLRKNSNKKGFFISIIHNKLFKIILNKLNLNFLVEKINGSILIFYSLKSYSYPSLIFEKFIFKYKNKIRLNTICINKKIVDYSIHKKISLLSSKKKSLKYLIVYIKNISIIKLLYILLIIKDIKFKG